MAKVRKEMLEIMKAHAVQMRMDADDDGQWITTENGHKVHLNAEGVPDKGNPHVLAAMNGNGGGPTKSRPGEVKFPSTMSDVMSMLSSRGIDEKQFWDMVQANGGNALQVFSTIQSMPEKETANPSKASQGAAAKTRPFDHKKLMSDYKKNRDFSKSRTAVLEDELKKAVKPGESVSVRIKGKNGSEETVVFQGQDQNGWFLNTSTGRHERARNIAGMIADGGSKITGVEIIETPDE